MSAPGEDGRPALLEAVSLSKSFGPVQVLKNIDLRIFGGEVHAIIGENGAGKST
ncbi:MAG TPA: ATP-binding cassette domain-containing protein, partial [Ochrobactrum intermedium]